MPWKFNRLWPVYKSEKNATAGSGYEPAPMKIIARYNS
jgi:hypothetical protein